MSLNILTFIIAWIIAVTFCIDYFMTARNKLIIFTLIIFSIHCLIYGIYIFSELSSNWLLRNPERDSVPTVFFLIPIYPYMLIFFGLFGLIIYSKKIKN